MKWPLKKKELFSEQTIPAEGSVGDFAFRRSFYYHPGIDLYCGLHDEIQAMEDGIVIKVEHFTGVDASPPSPWWNDTWSILIEGASGVLGYCEIMPKYMIAPGYKVKEGEVIAVVIPVLKKDKGNGTTMLHFEQYAPGTTDHVTWVLDTKKPKNLRNPRELLENVHLSNTKRSL